MGVFSVQCCHASVINTNRWIWDHSIEDVDFTSWAPGYPRSDNSQDDCAILSSSNGYKWTDVRFVYFRNTTTTNIYFYFIQLRSYVWLTNMSEGHGITKSYYNTLTSIFGHQLLYFSLLKSDIIKTKSQILQRNRKILGTRACQMFSDQETAQNSIL